MPRQIFQVGHKNSISTEEWVFSSEDLFQLDNWFSRQEEHMHAYMYTIYYPNFVLLLTLTLKAMNLW